MLQLIAEKLLPATLHRFLLRHAHRVRLVWWRLAGTRAYDVRVIALDAEDRVLLVLHSYGSYGWMPPGGSPDRGEVPITAAVRELREETGCGLADARVVAMPELGAQHQRTIVVGRAVGTPKVDGREIVEARFCALDALPEPSQPTLAEQLGGWLRLYYAHAAE